MAAPKIVGAQRDFSGGELDEALKRADDIAKTGARQIINFRILRGGQATNRPGRRALFLETGRVEEVLMSPGNIFYLSFGDHYVRVYNAAGARVAESHIKADYSPIPWTAATAGSIVFAVIPGAAPQIVMAYGHDFPFNVPLILTWDGVSQTSTWILSNFSLAVLPTGQKRAIFNRLSPPNITIMPAGTSGVVTLTANAPVFTPGMIGTLLTWCGRQVQITGYGSPTSVQANCIEQLPSACNVALGQFITTGADSIFVPGQNGTFNVGDLVEGSISGFKGVVLGQSTTLGLAGTGKYLFYTSFNSLRVQIIPTATGGTLFPIWQEYCVGPNGNAQVGSAGYAPPGAVSIWDDEVMNNYRGWPTSVFFDQNRLGFCGFGTQPNAVAWSAEGLYSDFYVNGVATDLVATSAIYDLAPQGSRVFFVVPGMESSEFVFCDNAVYYLPITATLPLTPGSVSFQLLSSQGSYPGIRPKQIQQSIIYVRSGGTAICAVQTPGFYYRPNVIDIVSEHHGHLFSASTPIALAAPQSSTQFEENYVYLLRADGVIVTSGYLIRNGLLEPGPEGKPKMGWVQWTGAGAPAWISAQEGDLIISTRYSVTADPWSNGFSPGFGAAAGTPIGVVEVLDANHYLDMAVAVNAPPPALTPPGGKGPLWFIAGQPVFLIDLGTRIMDTYQTDASGYLIPKFTAGEDLQSLQLIAGQAWTATLEPFAPNAPPGQDARQRMVKRRVTRLAAYVSNSNGFTMAKFMSEPGNVGAPPLGTNMNFFRVPAWNIGDNPTLAPPLREEAYRWRPTGRAFDPRCAIIKDTPGPLVIHEIGYELTV